MKKKRFSIKEALSFGWQATKTNFGFFFTILLVLFIIALLFSVGIHLVRLNSAGGYMLLTMLSALFNIFVSIGIITITLALAENKPLDIFDFFTNIHLILKYFAASIFYSLIVFFGCLIFLIPGIILAIRLQFFAYVLIDRKLGPIQALKQSARLTKSCTFSLFLFGIILMLLNFAGVLVLGVGLFVTIPVSFIALAYIYKKLAKQSEVINPTAPAAN